MTRAPRSASTIVQYGPESTRVKSITVMPVRGPGIGGYSMRSRWTIDRSYSGSG